MKIEFQISITQINQRRIDLSHTNYNTLNGGAWTLDEQEVNEKNVEN